jgi:murein DD-endopeptidase MepM/ murein hydrolase activator NlpD
MLLLIPLGRILAEFHLQSFTFSFSLLTVLFLFTLHQRKTQPFLHLVLIQYYNAEKTVYKYLSSLQRFRNAHLAKVALPFWGEWKVSQGYEGKITHLGDWSKALDFVITDEEGKTYSEPGLHRDDFFCYDKPVLAPLDGYVYDIVNHVEENEISGVNTGQNWGNTIIMNHLNGLYSQISHIRKDSFKVSIGDYVTKGTALATCGNSGRSPEPHIHFQMQASPNVGAKTLDYPPACFIEHAEGTKKLHIAEVPQEGMVISNVEVASLLKESFTFAPGKKFSFLRRGDNHLTEWEVLTDAWNRSYIFCSVSHSYAYFENDGAMFRFTDFEGSRKSLLFYFYLGQFRHLLGCYPTITVRDDVPLIHRSSKWLQWLQDFVAPFYLFTRADYGSCIARMDNPHNPSDVTLHSEVSARAFGQQFGQLNFETRLRDGKISEFTITHPNRKEVYQCA